MSKELLISSTSFETKLAILEGDQVTEIFVERADNRRILGNIYKGKVTRVLPGMQAAFVDIGLGRDSFLYVSDFFEDDEEYEALFSGEEGEFGSLPTAAEDPSRMEAFPGNGFSEQLRGAVGNILPDTLDSPVNLSTSTMSEASLGEDVRDSYESVSYTHLTLPTKA